MKKASTTMKKTPPIDARIKEQSDWRSETLARVRMLIKQADPEVIEEWSWRCMRHPQQSVFDPRGLDATVVFEPERLVPSAQGEALVSNTAKIRP